MLVATVIVQEHDSCDCMVWVGVRANFEDDIEQGTLVEQVV